MHHYLLLFPCLVVTSALQAGDPWVGEQENVTVNVNTTTNLNVTKDSKSLFFLFVKPNPNPLAHQIHHLLHAIKHPHKPTYNTPCGKPHCPGSPQPTGPSATLTTPPPSPTPLPAINVDNCTCISSALCLPADTVNQGEGLINPRNLCQPGLVCCLVVPFIPIEIARLQWGQTGRLEKKENGRTNWGERQGKNNETIRWGIGL